MRTTVTIDYDVLEELMKETKARSKASAVKEAVRDYLKRQKLKKIKSLKGQLEFDFEADEIRHHER